MAGDDLEIEDYVSEDIVVETAPGSYTLVIDDADENTVVIGDAEHLEVSDDEQQIST